MMITLDHVSTAAREDIRDIALNEFDNYPLNAFHNNPNERLVKPKDKSFVGDVIDFVSPKRGPAPGPSEYDFDRRELRWIRTSGGIFGVRLLGADAKDYPASGVTEDCAKTSGDTAQILAYLLDQGMSLGYSLDANTVVKGLPSRTALGKCEDLGHGDFLHTDRGGHVTHGLAHIGQMEKFHRELEEVGLKPRYLRKLKNDGTEAFLRMWGKSEGYITEAPPGY